LPLPRTRLKRQRHRQFNGKKTFGGTAYEVCNSAQQTSDGGYVMVGSTTSFGTGVYNIWLVKTDTNGTTCDYSTSGVIAPVQMYLLRPLVAHIMMLVLLFNRLRTEDI